MHGLERIGTQLMLDYMRALLRAPRMGRSAQRAIAVDPARLHADRQSRRHVGAHAFEPERRRPDAQRAAKRRRARAVSRGRAAHRPLAAVVSRQRRRVDGSGERGAAVGGRGGADLAAAQFRARLPFRLRLGRQHLVSLRAHRAPDAASRRDVPAEDDVRAVVSASRLRVRAAEPPVSVARRPVGLRVRPVARAEHLPADDARTRLVALDQEESARSFSRASASYNPIKAHRTRRVLRRHPNFFDFLTRAAFSSHRWLPRGEFRQQVMQQAAEHWWRKSAR